jgi:hypothetical protein
MTTLCPYYQSGSMRRAGPHRLEPPVSYCPPEVTAIGTSRIRSADRSTDLSDETALSFYIM